METPQVPPQEFAESMKQEFEEYAANVDLRETANPP